MSLESGGECDGIMECHAESFVGLITTFIVEHVILEIFHDWEESTTCCIGDGLAIRTDRTLGNSS